MSESIELDCPPGCPRPNDLIGQVLEGTRLTAEPASTIFGLAVWHFDVSREEWEARIQPMVAPRIKALHEDGVIRYGSW